MKTRRQRVLLTAVAIAGSVALYGCGGGDSGPDKTPFNQTDVDRAAAEAKQKAEMRLDAIEKAMASKAMAAMEAKKAKTAADAAAAAATAAATAATTAGLSLDEAMKQKDVAEKQSGIAAAAYEAAKMAASDAAAQAARHMDAKEHSDDAMASANAAKASAAMAAASAMAAARSLATAQSVKSDRDTTGGLASAAGVHAETAKQQAKIASDEADKAMAQVKMAKDAKTDKEAEDARKAAMAARAAAMKASEAADTAAKAAEAIDSEASAVATKKKEARNHATAAMTSLGKADVYLAQTAGYVDVRKARDLADAGKMDLASHKDLMGRVPWIGKATTSDAKLDNAVKPVRNAAEGIERSTNADVIKARQADLATALTAVQSERTKAGNDLMVATKAYDAAKPFSENGTGISAGNLASGETLRHPNGMLALKSNAVRVFAADSELAHQGKHDTINANMGVVSWGEVKAGTPKDNAKYRLAHNNRWGPGTGKVYQFMSYGLWTRKDVGYPLPGVGNDNVNTAVDEVNTFVFANASALSPALPKTGTATFTGHHLTQIRTDAGAKGQNGGTSVTPALGTGTNRLKYRFRTHTATATIDFSKDTADLLMNHRLLNRDAIAYDIVGIELNGSRLSKGSYSGRAAADASRRNFSGGFGSFVTYDPIGIAGVQPSTPIKPVVTLNGGVFGPKAEEIAGTIRVVWTNPHGESGNNLATARDATITIDTAFGLRNDEFNSGTSTPP